VARGVASGGEAFGDGLFAIAVDELAAADHEVAREDLASVSRRCSTRTWMATGSYHFQGARPRGTKEVANLYSYPVTRPSCVARSARIGATTSRSGRESDL
jgi:hypothetical protein